MDERGRDDTRVVLRISIAFGIDALSHSLDDTPSNGIGNRLIHSLYLYLLLFYSPFFPLFII